MQIIRKPVTVDTENDIKRRKGFAIDAIHKLKYIFNANKLSIATKVKAFNTYIASIFLYDSDRRENSSGSFHRRVLRTFVINIKWPKTITNENVYEITKVKPRNTLIKIRRLMWFGHAIRLPNDTPVKIAISYAKEQYKRCRGRPIITCKWLQLCKWLQNN